MHVIRSSAAAPALRRWLSVIIPLTLGTFLICYGVALARGNRSPAVYDYLYGREAAADGSYQWAPPTLRLFVPFELGVRAVYLSQRLTAGPDSAATRPLSITSAGVITRFSLSGGTPARVYHYLLPTDGQVLAAAYRISPLSLAASGEQRDLGFVLYTSPGTRLRPLGGSAWPALSLLAIVLIAPLALVVLDLWGLGRRPWLAGGALALMVVAIYGYSPDPLLVPALAIMRGQLIWVVCAGICRRMLGYRSAAALLVALCVAAVTVPLIYVANDLWLNMGTQWYAPRAQLLALLSLPLLAGLALAHPRGRPYAAWGAALAAAGACAFGAWNLWEDLTARPYDFTIYWQAAQRLRQGLPIYEAARLALTPFDVYKYHPLFLGFILPLTSLSLPTAALVWKALNLLSLAIGGVLVVAGYRRNRLLLSVALLILALNLSPITQSVRLGQVDGLLILGLALFLASRGSARWRWVAGGLWSLMALVKVYPAVVGLPDMLRRRWRLVAAAGVSAGILILLSGALFGWANEATFWGQVVPSLGARTTRLSNQSLYGLIGRTLYPASINSGNQATSLPLVSALHMCAAAAVLGATLWAIWRHQNGAQASDGGLSAASAMICAALLAIPVSWDHYQAVLLIPLLGAVAIVLRHGAQAGGLLGSYTLLAFGTYKQVQNGLLDSAVVLFLASYRTLGLLLLWGWWLYWLWGGSATASAASSRSSER